MIVTKEEMLRIEQQSGQSVEILMEQAGTACAGRIRELTSPEDIILILCGKGNNGGDGFVIARALTDRRVMVFLAEGAPVSAAALNAFQQLDEEMLVAADDFPAALAQCTVIVDAVYGFGFHGTLSDAMRGLFRQVNRADKTVISIDINSGCECDSGRCDPDAVHSDITLALDCYKPFHMLRKHHRMFRTAELLPLGLPHDNIQGLTEMDEDRFLALYPERDETAYKGTYGKTFIIAGSRGMAGALCLNLIGARTAGAGYVCCLCDESIYPIAAVRCLTPVFYPLSSADDRRNALQAVLEQAASVSFGSGINRLEGRQEILDTLLGQCRVPLVLDAEGLRMIKDPNQLRQAACPLILTPHIGEFSALSHMDAEAVEADRPGVAAAFATEYNVVLVLKGGHTIVASPQGKIYINQSGNPALAQAGSGDLLTGIITALLPQLQDPYMSAVAGVWLHGHLADLALLHRAVNMVDLDSWPELMNEFLFRRGR